MVTEFKFPDVGEGITEGTIVKWKIKQGDSVKADQAIVEIETDKAIVDIPSPKAGIILNTYHKEGETIKVGEVLAVIGKKGEKIKKKIADKKSVKKKEEHYTGSVIGVLSDEVTELPSVHDEKVEESKVKRTHVTLRVRKLAKKLNVNIDAIMTSGRITENDIKQAAKGSIKGESVELKGLRKITAEHMVESFKNTVPVTNFYDLDVTNLWNKRQIEKIVAQKKGIKLTFMAYIVEALTATLKNHPYMNSSLVGNNLILKKEYNIGFAVDSGEGLIVPVIKNADKKKLYDLAKEIVDLAKKAQTRKVTLDELKGGTFTISNLGSIGVKYFTPVINYPESAILGLGKIEDQIGTNGEDIILKKVIPLSLTYDHKIIDGATASRFMNDFMEKLSE